MVLTLEEKTNLCHIMFIVPLVYISVYPEIVRGMDTEYVRNVFLFMIMVGSLYHAYRFMTILDA